MPKLITWEKHFHSLSLFFFIFILRSKYKNQIRSSTKRRKREEEKRSRSRNSTLCNNYNHKTTHLNFKLSLLLYSSFVKINKKLKIERKTKLVFNFFFRKLILLILIRKEMPTPVPWLNPFPFLHMSRNISCPLPPWGNDFDKVKSSSSMG